MALQMLPDPLLIAGWQSSWLDAFGFTLEPFRHFKVPVT